MLSAREAARLTQKDVQAALGVAQSTLSELETQSHSSGRTVEFASLYGCDPGWLATGEGSPGSHPAAPRGRPKSEPGYPAIPLVEFKLSARESGFEVRHLDEAAQPVIFHSDWYRARGLDPDHLYAVKVVGASMENGLYDGDTVIVNTADTVPADGEVFAINFEGNFTIRRLIRDSGQWWMSSDNADQRRHPRRLADESALILGRVVGKHSERI